jgi:hypothetical protein
METSALLMPFLRSLVGWEMDFTINRSRPTALPRFSANDRATLGGEVLAGPWRRKRSQPAALLLQPQNPLAMLPPRALPLHKSPSTHPFLFMRWVGSVEKLSNRVDATPSSRFCWNKKAAGAPLLHCSAELFNSARWVLALFPRRLILYPSGDLG